MATGRIKCLWLYRFKGTTWMVAELFEGCCWRCKWWLWRCCNSTSLRYIDFSNGKYSFPNSAGETWHQETHRSGLLTFPLSYVWDFWLVDFLLVIDLYFHYSSAPFVIKKCMCIFRSLNIWQVLYNMWVCTSVGFAWVLFVSQLFIFINH